MGKKLGDLGYDEESLFCLAVHHWLAAHDQRGISGKLLQYVKEIISDNIDDWLSQQPHSLSFQNPKFNKQ